MTKEEFLRDPVEAYLNALQHDTNAIPDEWFREAWDIEEDDPEYSLRQYVTGEISQDASSGSIAAIEKWIGSLSLKLRSDQWVGLFVDVRLNDPHREDEIRETFDASAPNLASQLPQRLTRAEVVELLGSEEAARNLGIPDDE